MSLVASAPTKPQGQLGISARMRGPEPLALLLLTVAVFALRLSQIDQSLLGDEIFTYQDVHGHSFSSVLRTVHTGGENSPPLYFLLAWLSAKLGDPTVWIRLPSVVFGAATLPVVYALGRQTIGGRAGLVGAAILALSPFSLYYGVEARPYATMAFFVVLSTLALLRALDTRARGWWLVYALAAAAAAYSHYTSIFVLGAQAAWSLWVCRDRLREPLIANGLIALLYLPWLPQLRGKQLAVIALLEPLNLSNVLRDLPRPVAGYPYATLHAIPTAVGLVALALCTISAVGALTLSKLRLRGAGRGEPQPANRLALLAGLALATPVGLLVYSMLGTDLWLARGLYASLPVAALVLGALLVRQRAPIRLATVAVVLLTLLGGTVRALGENYRRPPFRAMAEYLDRVARPHDPVIYISFVAPLALSAQFHKPHATSASSPAVWRRISLGSSAYVVFDDTIARQFKVAPPNPPGFALIGRRHYSGLFPTDLLSYRRLS